MALAFFFFFNVRACTNRNGKFQEKIETFFKIKNRGKKFISHPFHAFLKDTSRSETESQA